MNSSDGISHESEGGQPIDELATFENVINNQEINLKNLKKIKSRDRQGRGFAPPILAVLPSSFASMESRKSLSSCASF
jgi:hypothetical protein